MRFSQTNNLILFVTDNLLFFTNEIRSIHPEDRIHLVHHQQDILTRPQLLRLGSLIRGTLCTSDTVSGLEVGFRLSESQEADVQEFHRIANACLIEADLPVVQLR